MLRYAWNKNNSLLLCAGTFFFANVIIISGDISISFDHPTPGEKMLLSCKNIFLARFLEGFCRNSNFAPKPGHQIKIAYFPCLRTSLQTCSKERAKISERKEYCKIFLGLQGPYRIIEYNRFPPVHAKKLTSLKGKTKIEEKILA